MTGVGGRTKRSLWRRRFESWQLDGLIHRLPPEDRVRIRKATTTGRGVEDDGYLSALTAELVRPQARSFIVIGPLWIVLVGLGVLRLTTGGVDWLAVVHVLGLLTISTWLVYFAARSRRAIGRLAPYADDEALVAAVRAHRPPRRGGPEGFPRGSWWPPRDGRGMPAAKKRAYSARRAASEAVGQRPADGDAA